MANFYHSEMTTFFMLSLQGHEPMTSWQQPMLADSSAIFCVTFVAFNNIRLLLGVSINI